MKIRLFVYALFLGFLVYIFVKGKGSFHIPHLLYLLIAVAVIFAAYLHICVSGFDIRIDEKGIYKEWNFLGYVYHRSKMANLSRIAVSLDPESLMLGEITDKGTIGGCTFGLPRGFNYLKKDPNYVSLCDFRSFVGGLFSKAGYVEIDENSKKAASDMKIVLGERVKIVDS